MNQCPIYCSHSHDCPYCQHITDLNSYPVEHITISEGICTNSRISSEVLHINAIADTDTVYIHPSSLKQILSIGFNVANENLGDTISIQVDGGLNIEYCMDAIGSHVLGADTIDPLVKENYDTVFKYTNISHTPKRFIIQLDIRYSHNN